MARLRLAMIGGLAGLCGLLAPAQALGWSLADQLAGERAHEVILARFGGAYDENGIGTYVEEVGSRLVEVSARPRDPWIFTVLDTPDVNAFAVPGGHVYVTRGLLALANSEAELAGVLAHEISHVTQGHLSQTRQGNASAGISVLAGAVLGGRVRGRAVLETTNEPVDRVAARAVTAYTREQELDADRSGIRLMARAGYDPEAHADFLDNLAELKLVSDTLAGPAPDPHTVSYLDIHPSSAARMREAVRQARESGLPEGSITDRGEIAYMSAIQGLMYGDSPRHGLVRGRQYLNPVRGFGFTLPDGFEATNFPDNVIAEDPSGNVMVMDSLRAPINRLDSYIRDDWAPEITRNVKAGYLYDLRLTEIAGLPAATAYQPYEDAEGPKVAQLVVIRQGDQHHRFRNIGRAEDIEAGLAMEAAVESFRVLTPEEIAELRPYRIQVYRVQSGDTLNMLTAAMSLRTLSEQRFRTLNDLDDGKVMMVGDLVKLIVE